MEDLFAVLGVPRGTSGDDLKRAWRVAARAAHPDGGGSHEAFLRVQHAWEILSDSDLSAAYLRTSEAEAASSGATSDQRRSESGDRAQARSGRTERTAGTRDFDAAADRLLREHERQMRKMRAQAEATAEREARQHDERLRRMQEAHDERMRRIHEDGEEAIYRLRHGQSSGRWAGASPTPGRCTATTRTGRPCANYPVAGGDRCSVHRVAADHGPEDAQGSTRRSPKKAPAKKGWAARPSDLGARKVSPSNSAVTDTAFVPRTSKRPVTSGPNWPFLALQFGWIGYGVLMILRDEQFSPWWVLAGILINLTIVLNARKRRS